MARDERGGPPKGGRPGRRDKAHRPGARRAPTRSGPERPPRLEGAYEPFAPTKHKDQGWRERRPRKGERDVLFVATKNTGKARELAHLLEGGGLAVVGPALMRRLQAPVEDGATFEQNAVKKALHYSRLVDHVVIADDSGLEIDALDGAPGVRSARFGGPAATDADRVRLVLARLDGVEWEQRTARFRCAIAIAREDKLLARFEGSVEGLIAFEPDGAEGFGYDPIFFYPPARKTFAEMAPEEKHRVSHRGEALGKAIDWLRDHPAEWGRASGPGGRSGR